MIIRRKPIHRRTLLKGMLGGAAVTVALPPLEAFLGQLTAARATESAYPTRFGIFSWGNGVHPQHWIPDDIGPDWIAKEQLRPFENVRQKLAVITGMEVKAPNNDAHGSGPGGLLSGVPLLGTDGYTRFGGPSIDQMIASEKGGETRFRSIEVAVQPNGRGLSFSDRDTRLPPESSPAAVFNRLFGPQFRAPGDEPIIDPKLALRRSVLDVVLDDVRRLSDKLGAADKQRLAQHLNAVRDLELRIARLQDEPPNLAACERPQAMTDAPDLDGRPQMSLRARAMADLLVMAYACDLTRVASLWYSDPLSDVLYPGASAGHHQLTHDEPGDMPTVKRITESIMLDGAYFLEQLEQIQEGDGTLLDHSAILFTTDVSYARTHQIDEYPILVAGRAGGRLNSGFHYRSETKENACMVSLSLIRALGLNRAKFGEGPDETSQGLRALEVSA